MLDKIGSNKMNNLLLDNFIKILLTFSPKDGIMKYRLFLIYNVINLR